MNPQQHSPDWQNVRLVIQALSVLAGLALFGGLVLVGVGVEVPDALWIIAGNAVTAVATLLTQGRTGSGQRASDAAPAVAVENAQAVSVGTSAPAVVTTEARDVDGEKP